MRHISALDARQVLRSNLAVHIADLTTADDQGLRLATVRLAASRLSPITPQGLVAATSLILRGLLPGGLTSAAEIDADIDSLILSGDIISAKGVTGGSSQTMLFLAPPLFVRRKSGSVFVMGAVPEAASPFASITRALGALRELVPPPSDQDLIDAGFLPFPIGAWIEAPVARLHGDLLKQLDDDLARLPRAGDVEELEIVDPNQPHTYYRGRWTTGKGASGNFVARRRRKWGGRAWGYAELSGGVAVKFRTFPAIDARFRACDEAWWTICAADAAAGKAQTVVVRRSGSLAQFVVNTPLPMWIERRLLSVGTLTETPPRGALLAYDVRAADADEELAFLQTHLWMVVEEDAAIS